MTTKQEILASLNPEQRDAVVNFYGNQILSAGAGAGKTKTIVSRVQYMLKSGIKGSRIIVLTFTKKAAIELQERIAQAVDPTSAASIVVSTYHSFCCKILRRFYKYIGRKSNFSIYDTDDQEKILSPIVKSYFKGIGVEPMSLSTVKNYISRFKSEGLSPVEAQIKYSDTSYGKACGFIYQSYTEALEQNNACDFDDLPYLCARIAKKYPEVREYLTTTFDFILSDESQDSNKQNLDLILLIGSLSQNTLFVGDPSQSIYLFRGADVQNYLATTANFEHKYLSINYRSTQHIVNAANAVIANNSARIDYEVKSNNELGSKIAVVRCPDVAQEALWITQQIEKMHQEGSSYEDFAILCRTGAQTKNFEKAFLSHHIPYQVKGACPFFCRAHIKDIMGYIRYADNSNDQIALDRILNVPARGIGDATRKRLFEALQNTEIHDIINSERMLKNVGSNKTARTNLKSFGDIIQNIKNMIKSGANVGNIVRYVIDAISYTDYLAKEVKEAVTLQEKFNDVSELIYLASTYNNIDEFLNNAILDNTEVDDKDETKVKGVKVMTMHSSKGLEFPVVFIAGASDNCNPFYLSHDSVQNVEEERRLWYVAMTRAEKELCITYPQSIVVNGKDQKQEISRFVKEIPKEYMDVYSIC